MQEVLQHFILNHEILWNIVIFILMTISNIFPIMFFILPDIAIFLWIFIAKKMTVWYIPYILLIVWAFIWEFISYLIWYKYWYKILEHKYLQKDIVQKWINKLEQNPIRILIIWKITPWVSRFIAVLSGCLKTNPIKYAIVNFIMVIYGISSIFLVWLVWINFLWQYIKEQYIWYSILWILVLYGIFYIYKMKRKLIKK